MQFWLPSDRLSGRSINQGDDTMTIANNPEGMQSNEAQGSGQSNEEIEYLCPDCGGVFYAPDSDDDTVVCVFCGCWCCGKNFE